jgi:hypothetical protein
VHAVRADYVVHAVHVKHSVHEIHMNIPSDPNDFEEHAIRATLPFSSHFDQFQF